MATHTISGRFIAAGPLEPRTGGFILAQGDSRAQLEPALSADPFVALGLVDVAVLACTPAIRHDAFPARWAAAAKPPAA